MNTSDPATQKQPLAVQKQPLGAQKQPQAASQQCDYRKKHIIIANFVQIRIKAFFSRISKNVVYIFNVIYSFYLFYRIFLLFF